MQAFESLSGGKETHSSVCTDALIFDKVNSHTALLQLPHDSHDKSDGGKRQHCGEHLFVASSHQVMVLGKVFHEGSFFFFFSVLFCLGTSSRVLSQRLLLPGEERPFAGKSLSVEDSRNRTLLQLLPWKDEVMYILVKSVVWPSRFLGLRLFF